MSGAARLAGYGVGLVALFAASFGVGVALRPAGGEGAGSPETEEPRVSGLSSSQDGYTLAVDTPTLEPGTVGDFRFRIVGPDGSPVRSYRTQHERDLHLIVASRDLRYFSHIHPTLGEDGVWSVPVEVPAAGAYRAFADFAVAGGPALTLGADVTAGNGGAPGPLPAPSTTAIVDGYQVTLTGAPSGPGDAEVGLVVSRDGRPVTDLEPYLGAYGHLVALRAGDLAYLHVHPEGRPHDGHTTAGPEVGFGAHFPTAGAYRVFFDFQHQGTVRTAAFTLTVPGSAGSSTTKPAGHGERGH